MTNEPMKNQTKQNYNSRPAMAGALFLPGLLLVPVACLLLLGCEGAKEPEVRLDAIEIVDFGIYKVQPASAFEAEDMPRGKINLVDESVLIRQTDRIPAEMGLVFGVTILAHGAPSGASVDIVCRDTYPGLPDPRLEEPMKTAEFEWSTTVGRTSPSLYTFEDEWELVPGEWTFEFWHQGRKLAEKTFIVHQP